MTTKEIEDETVRAVGASGALTSGNVAGIWKVPASLVESAARRMDKGTSKGYPVHNWRGGLDDVAFLRDRFNHAATHLMRLGNGDNSIDNAQGNLDAVSWFCAMLNEAIRLHPDVVEKAFYSECRDEREVIK